MNILDLIPIIPTRGWTVSSDRLAISNDVPLAIVRVLDTHVKRTLAIVVVSRPASPSCATIIADPWDIMQSGRTTAIAIALNPIDFDAIRFIDSTITVVILAEATTTYATG